MAGYVAVGGYLQVLPLLRRPSKAPDPAPPPMMVVVVVVLLLRRTSAYCKARHVSTRRYCRRKSVAAQLLCQATNLQRWRLTMRRVPELRQTVDRMQREQQQQRRLLLLLTMVVLRRLWGAETAETPRRLQAPAAAEAAPACRQQLLPLPPRLEKATLAEARRIVRTRRWRVR